MRKSKLWRKILLGLWTGALSALLVWGFTTFIVADLFESLEQRTYDMRYRWKYSTTEKRKPIEDIILVDIDDRSMDKLGRYQKWPRSYHAQVVDFLSEADASVIAFDILMTDPDTTAYEADKIINGLVGGSRDFLSGLSPRSKERVKEGLYDLYRTDFNHDLHLINSTRSSGRVIHALILKNKSDYPFPSDYADKITEESFIAVGSGSAIELPEEIRSHFETKEVLDGAFPELAAAGFRVASVNVVADQDGIYRKTPLFFNYLDHTFPALSVQMVALKLGVDLSKAIIEPGERLVIDPDSPEPRVVPIDDRGRLLINYKGRSAFRSFSYYDIMMKRVPPPFFKDKIVLLGSSAPALFDLVASPLGDNFPGVEIHANLINGILANDHIRVPNNWQKFLLILLLGVIASLPTALVRSMAAFIFSFAVIAVYFVIAVILFWNNSIWLEMVSSVNVIILSVIIVLSYRYITEEREKKYIKGAFQHYLSPTIIEQLVENPDMLSLGGERKVLTAYFSDVAGFSTISEKLSPEELVSLLNEYLTEMCDIILDYEGTVDKFEGDAIIAFFGAPISYDDHAKRACFASLDMQARLVERRKVWAEQGRPEINVRMGVNTGPMVVGNMGSKTRMDYTMMGDSVNLAARLEGAGKQYGIYTMISQFTYEVVKEFVEVRELDRIRVMGKEEPVVVYELLNRAGELDGDSQKLVTGYNRALVHYKGAKFKEAGAEFAALLKDFPEDGPAKTYIARCEEFATEPPPSDWDGVYVLKSK
jgi:adenylate cyclase